MKIKILYNKYRKILGISSFCVAGLLLFNLIIGLLTDSTLAEYFYSKGEFSKTEFLLKNKYNIEDTLCKKGNAKRPKLSLLCRI